MVSVFYFLLIDDFSLFYWIYLLKRNQIRFLCLFILKSTFENSLSHLIKTLQSDGGGDFISIEFKKFLATNGIVHQVVCPHIPSQNGVAERKHCHIIETTRALLHLQTTSMSIKFWGEAALTAVYLINRQPLSVNKFVSPYQKLFDTTPDYNFFKSFW